MSDYLAALEAIADRPSIARITWLCSEANPDLTVRDAWRAKVIRLASGDLTPTFGGQLGNAAGAVGRAIGAMIGGEQVLATAEQAAERLAICRACEHYVGGRCELCGCWTQPKAHVATEQCPDNPPRWGRIE